jgi:NTP pyrophosphatase (non-canonical NTP hydrolase)
MKISEQLRYWSNKAYGKEPPIKIATILAYEAVDIAKEQIRLEDYPEEGVIRKANIKTAVGDVLAMVQLYCAVMGFDLYELYMEGCLRSIERSKEKLQGKGGF